MSSPASAGHVGGRRASRQRAVEVLFEADVRRRPIDATLDRIDADPHADAVDEFARGLIRGVASMVAALDSELDLHAHNWKVARMPLIDRNLLRLGLYEMRHGDATPAVVIDEAVELAKQLGGDDTPRFINGVLSAAHRAGADDVVAEEAAPAELDAAVELGAPVDLDEPVGDAPSVEAAAAPEQAQAPVEPGDGIASDPEATQLGLLPDAETG